MKEKREQFRTPFRKCMYPFLQKPQESDGYKDTFKIALILNGQNKEDADILRQISQMHKDAGGTQKSTERGHPVKKYAEKHIEDDGTEKWIDVKDTYTVTFKRYADNCDHIPTYDTKNNVLWEENNFVANGSVVKVAWSPYFYDTGGNKGVFLSLDGVQIKELIRWQGVDADSLGFDTDTEGYVKDDDVEKVFDDNGGTAKEPGDDLGEQDGSPVKDDDLPF